MFTCIEMDKFSSRPAKPALKTPNNADPVGILLSETIDLMGAPIDYNRDNEIYGEGEPTEYIYKVLSGAVRVYKILDDGRRQISGFYLPGGILRIEVSEEHRLSAEAIIKSRLLVVKRDSIFALAARQNKIASDLWSITARELDHVQSLMVTLGRKNAHERVAAFLLEMARRSNGSLPAV